MNSKMPKSFIVLIVMIGLLASMFIGVNAIGDNSLTEIFSDSMSTTNTVITTKYNSSTVEYSSNINSTSLSTNTTTQIDNFFESTTGLVDYEQYDVFKYTVSGEKAIIKGCDSSAEGSITIPEKINGYAVTEISTYAFNGCAGIVEVTIPASITSIGNAPFSNCTSLKKIIVDPNNNYYSNDESGVLFDKCNRIIIQYPAGRVQTEYTAPSDIYYVGYGAFANSQNLTKVFLQASVGDINMYAFSDCPNLKEISFSLRVYKVKSMTFYKCPNLSEFHYYGPEDYWNRTVVEKGNQDLLNANLHFVPYDGKQYYTEGIYTYILDDDGNAIIVDCDLDASEEIIVPSKLNGHTVTKIDKRAFEYCEKITSVKIPDTVTEIGYNAFCGCASLEEADLGKGVIRIDSYGFGNCKNLTTLRLPVSLERIEGFGISGCPNLKDVYYAGTEEQWNKVFIWDSDMSLYDATMHFGTIEEEPSESESTTNTLDPIPTPLPPTGGGVHNQTTFGSYPQSEVSDELLLSQLNSLTLNWKSYGYYYGDGTYGSMRQGNYMKYADVEYNGSKYRAVTFTKYRPLDTYGKTEPLYADFISHQQKNGYYTNNVYWFKYEPLVWLVLDEDTNLLLCQSVIDSQPYTNTIYRLATDSVEYEGWTEYSYEYYNDSEMTTYANDYATSSIRRWLNDDFYNTAFTDEEKQQIAITHRDNGSLEDKVFLLSEAEATNPDYGFYSMENDADYRPELITFASDYAKSQGLFSGYAAGGAFLMSQGRATQNENCRVGEYLETYGGGWYLRTPSISSSYSVMGGDSCYITLFVVDGTCVGVRPAIVLGEAEEPKDELTCCQKICKFFSSLWECICNFFSKIFAIIIETFTVIC